MSTDYRPLTPIRITDLFDGRLEELGVREHIIPLGATMVLKGVRKPVPVFCTTAHDQRVLTDGQYHVWVYASWRGIVSSINCTIGNNPNRILRAISDKFRCRIVSEHEPQYWGFDTEEERDAAWRSGIPYGPGS